MGIRDHRMMCWLLLASVALLLQRPATSLASNLSALPVAECRRTFHIGAYQCPPECLYIAPDPFWKCAALCLEPHECRVYNPETRLPDPENLLCEPCGVSGCKECRYKHKCYKCRDGFSLSEDGATCTHWLSLVFSTMMIAAAAAIVALITYVAIMLCCATPKNRVVLEHAERHRSFSKYRDHREPHQPLYDILTDMHRSNIAGVGLGLYMNFIVFIGWCGFILLMASLTLYFTTPVSDNANSQPHGCSVKIYADALREHRGELSTNPFSGNMTEMTVVHKRQLVGGGGAARTTAKGSFGSVSIGGVDHPYGSIEAFQKAAQHMGFIVYGLIMLATCVFAAIQRCHERRFYHEDNTLANYVALARGFPRDATYEEEIRTYFEKLLGQDIVGVSIAYDLWNEGDIIERLMDRHLELRDLSQGTYSPMLSRLMLKTTDEEHNAEAEELRLLREKALQVESSGYAFVVFHTDSSKWRAVDIFADLRERETDAEAAVAEAEVFDEDEDLDGSLVAEREAERDRLAVWRFRGKYQIHLKDFPMEPTMIQWENFGLGKPERLLRFFWGICVMCISVFVWSIIFYGPYAFYYTALTQVPGKRPSFLEDTFLGLIIAVGNGIMGEIVFRVGYWVGFQRKDSVDKYILVLNYITVMVNTLLDLYLGYVAAEGRVRDNAFLGQRHTGEEGHFAEITFGLLIPGTLVLPYLALPLVTHLAPWLVGRWVLRYSKRDMAARPAEKMLEPPIVDLPCKYGDLVINASVCLVMLFLVTDLAWPIFLFLIVFCIYTYWMDKWLFLRHSKRTFFSTSAVDDMVLRMWVVPTGVLAACPVYWGARRQVWEWWYIPIAIAAHTVVYGLLLEVLIPWLVPLYKDEKDEVYDEVRSYLPYDAFNTNPIHVLKSQQGATTDEAPLVYYEPGKDYLQGERFGSYEAETMTCQECCGGFRLQQRQQRLLMSHSHSPSPVASATQLPYSAAPQTQTRGWGWGSPSPIISTVWRAPGVGYARAPRIEPAGAVRGAGVGAVGGGGGGGGYVSVARGYV
ncbi:unnamed protein product [Vitrella brassicaformis CCMP3155]|uniref:TNFR-Cys domain-containing protein n=2 Tax=Vitrella brassicaformis TaxID=1169539 RepID=A0A0G4EQ60_VITBC|nr:unnamed protein product [Vitrella brassicaformis CCMP3155]|eukprot:CEL99542.1 unnamed protein product [Vitrella brassicaformis CCMP3155]